MNSAVWYVRHSEETKYTENDKGKGDTESHD